MVYRRCKVCQSKIPEGKLCECEISEKKLRQKIYDRKIRRNKENKKFDDFYNSKEWIRVREFIKRKYNGLCLNCLLNLNEIKSSDVIHHIEEIRTGVGWDRRLDAYNLVPLCHGCHNWLHGEYTEDKKEMLIGLLDRYKREYE